ncbi:hypothetical protein F3087_30560 [Nocardia colli]|uniref:Uncharacterized protein n=1 Tax=Nocardia colli TaxID=2545717 RepID=A0A5N0E889_9NOCA|nr:DUF6247 family protein [Nocardia colli]KAA8885176.1 hypothetical protein F3087_30560 [Nocardia colli]
MAAPHSHPANTPVPAAEPKALRAALTPALRAEFDREWDLVLEQAKESHTLEDVHALLNKWQHTAVMELREPGSYQRMLDKAARIQADGGRTTDVSIDDVRVLLAHRLQAG